MATTIKDVAKRAGVSTATVSLVVHNHNRISAKTRARVLKAIRELDYHPSRSARGLVSKQSGNIGFILRDDHFSRSEPFYTKIFLGTEFQAREDEYYILLTTVPATYATGDPLPRFVLERNVDGVILAGAVPGSLVTSPIPFRGPVYDWRELRRWRLPASRLPAGAAAHSRIEGRFAVAVIVGDIQWISPGRCTVFCDLGRHRPRSIRVTFKQRDPSAFPRHFQRYRTA